MTHINEIPGACPVCGSSQPSSKQGEYRCYKCGWAAGRCKIGGDKGRPCCGLLMANYPSGFKCIKCGNLTKTKD